MSKLYIYLKKKFIIQQDISIPFVKKIHWFLFGAIYGLSGIVTNGGHYGRDPPVKINYQSSRPQCS